MDLYRVEKRREEKKRKEKKTIDPDDSMFNVTIQEDGTISFEVRYYDGGCGFDEAIEESVKKISK